MSQLAERLERPSLAQLFDAPDGYAGRIGWMCGYSADAAFLNDAAERFTRNTEAQRAHEGRISLVLMLDPGNPAISIVDAPGIAHLPIHSINGKPFALLHAKVALLGFTCHGNPSKWALRLIVSTGNWTRQTIEESLDLAWSVDIRSDEMRSADESVKLRCADIKSAHALLSWLSGYFDLRILESNGHPHPSDAALAGQQWEAWLNECGSKAGRNAARFFDNRRESLLGQLPAGISNAGEAKSRNYLAMGSGFYEAPSNLPRVPTVLASIVGKLRSAGMLTRSADLDVFVQADACQAVARSVRAMGDAGFTVRPAAQPSVLFGNAPLRRLHAKFLFGANAREESNNCSSPWLYLGSGNLTRPGFTEKMSPAGGNLEAGVVFAPSALLWSAEKRQAPERVVTNVLPVQWDAKFEDGHVLDPGAGMPDRDAQYEAAPVAYLLWRELAAPCELHAPEDTAIEFDVLDANGAPCIKVRANAFVWKAQRPRQVRIRWTVDGRTTEGFVPVLDQFGRIAATALPKLDLDEAWWQLANFPMPPDEEDLPGNDESEDQGRGHESRTQGGAAVDGYPVRRMMELVENIAAKQTTVAELDWPAWCNRLEQTLTQAADTPVVRAFHSLRLNPLSPLRQRPFRPEFAETAQTCEGIRYEEGLTRIESAWNVAALAAIGDS